MLAVVDEVVFDRFLGRGILSSCSSRLAWIELNWDDEISLTPYGREELRRPSESDEATYKVIAQVGGGSP